MLFIPLLVWLLEVKLPRSDVLKYEVGSLILFAITAIGIYINFRILYDNNMSAGLFSPQDIDIYHLWLTKAYTKIPAMCLGFVLARIYLYINEQKLKGKEHFEVFRSRSCLSKAWLMILLSLSSLGLLGFLALYPRGANKDPPSWSRLKSAVFISLGRVAFLVCIMFLLIAFMMNNFVCIKRFFSRRLWAMTARLALSIYLVFPIVAG